MTAWTSEWKAWKLLEWMRLRSWPLLRYAPQMAPASAGSAGVLQQEPTCQAKKPNWWVTIVDMAGLAPGKYARCNAEYLMRTRREAAEESEELARQEIIKAIGIQPPGQAVSASQQSSETPEVEMF